MSERIAERVGDRPAYVSVDIDVLDPAHAPGTGTPEAGGLTSRELLGVLRSFTELRLIGADIVEQLDHRFELRVQSRHALRRLRRDLPGADLPAAHQLCERHAVELRPLRPAHRQICHHSLPMDRYGPPTVSCDERPNSGRGDPWK